MEAARTSVAMLCYRCMQAQDGNNCSDQGARQSCMLPTYPCRTTSVNASSLEEPDTFAFLLAVSCSSCEYICLQAFLMLFDDGMPRLACPYSNTLPDSLGAVVHCCSVFEWQRKSLDDDEVLMTKPAPQSDACAASHTLPSYCYEV